MESKTGLYPWSFDGQRLWVSYRIDKRIFAGKTIRNIVVLWMKEGLADLPLPETSPLFTKARRRFVNEVLSGKLKLAALESRV